MAQPSLTTLSPSLPPSSSSYHSRRQNRHGHQHQHRSVSFSARSMKRILVSMLTCMCVMMMLFLLPGRVRGNETDPKDWSNFSFTSTKMKSPGPGILYNVSYHDNGIYERNINMDIVRVGVMYSASGLGIVFGPHTRRLAISWMNDLLTNGIVGTTNVGVALALCEVATDPDYSLQCAQQMIDTSVDIVIGPETTNTPHVMPLFEKARIPVIAPISTQSFIFQCQADTMLPPCTRPGARRFHYLFGKSLAADLFRDDANIMQMQGARTAAFIVNSDKYGFNEEVCSTPEKAFTRAQQKFKVVYKKKFIGSYNETERISTIRAVATLNPDVVYYCDRENCNTMLQLLRRERYYPRSLMTIQCVDSIHRTSIEPGTTSSELSDGADSGVDGGGLTYGLGSMKHVSGTGGWDPRMRGPDYEEDATLGYASHFIGTPDVPSPMQFRNYFYALTFNQTGTKMEPTYSHSGIMMAYTLIEAAIATAYHSANDNVNSLSAIPSHIDSQLLYSAIPTIYMPSFNGRLNTDFLGLVRSSSTVRYQVGPFGTLEITSPPNSQTSAIVYPAPSYEERLFTNPLFQHTFEHIAIGVIAAIELMMALLMAMIVLTRRHDIMRAMSWKFGLVNILGAMILLLAPLTWTMNNNATQCHARLPLLFIGTLLFLCPIFARVYRLDQIFNDRHSIGSKAKRSNVWKDSKLAMVMMIPVIAMMPIFIISVSVFPLELVTYSPDPNDPYIAMRPSLNYTECAFTTNRFGTTHSGDSNGNGNGSGNGNADGSNMSSSSNDTNTIALSLIWSMIGSAFLLVCYVYYLARRTKNVPPLYNSPLEIVNSLFLFLVCVSVVLALIVSGATQSNREAEFGIRSIFIVLACAGSIYGLYFEKTRQAVISLYFDNPKPTTAIEGRHLKPIQIRPHHPNNPSNSHHAHQPVVGHHLGEVNNFRSCAVDGTRASHYAFHTIHASSILDPFSSLQFPMPPQVTPATGLGFEIEDDYGNGNEKEKKNENANANKHGVDLNRSELDMPVSTLGYSPAHSSPTNDPTIVSAPSIHIASLPPKTDSPQMSQSKGSEQFLLHPSTPERTPSTSLPNQADLS